MADRRAAVVAEALAWIGTPYRHQASLKGVGCDCLGLVRGVWRAVVGDEPEAVPAYTPDWAEAGGRETLLAAAGRHLVALSPPDGSAAEAAANLGPGGGLAGAGGLAGLHGARPLPGDVLVFRWRAGMPAKHLGILVEPEAFVHAHDGRRVARAALVPWWKRRVAGVFSFPGVER